MELSNNLTEIHALVYALLARINVLELRVIELEGENKALRDENMTYIYAGEQKSRGSKRISNTL